MFTNGGLFQLPAVSSCSVKPQPKIPTPNILSLFLLPEVMFKTNHLNWGEDFFVEKKTVGIWSHSMGKAEKKTQRLCGFLRDYLFVLPSFRMKCWTMFFWGDDYAIFIYSTSNLVRWRKISTRRDWDVIFMSLGIFSSDVRSSEVHFSVHHLNFDMSILKRTAYLKRATFSKSSFLVSRNLSWISGRVTWDHFTWNWAMSWEPIRSTFTKMR